MKRKPLSMTDFDFEVIREHAAPALEKAAETLDHFGVLSEQMDEQNRCWNHPDVSDEEFIASLIDSLSWIKEKAYELAVEAHVPGKSTDSRLAALCELTGRLRTLIEEDLPEDDPTHKWDVINSAAAGLRIGLLAAEFRIAERRKDTNRGAKTIKGSSKGGQSKAADCRKEWPIYQAAVDDVRRLLPDASQAHVRRVAASRTGVHESTIRRRTKDPGKRK